MDHAQHLVVGFDLDMTLIDTRPGFSATLAVLARETGVDLDVEAMCERLGPPIHEMLAPYFPAADVPALGERFRALYAEHAIPRITEIEGAHEALAAVRRHRGETVVVTGKVRRNAVLHVDGLRFDIDHLVGGVWGAGKGEVLAGHGASIYVGDHVLDVAGARAAGATSVSVLSGGCTAEELREAGTDVVLESLVDFPEWLDDHLLSRRCEALEADLRARGSVLVAFSGGADSALLLAAAVRTLGAENVAAATAYSASLPESERSPAAAFCRELGVRLFTPRTNEMDREGYRANAGDRCYFCKAELLDVLGPVAAENGLAHVATGTNADDAVAGFRPGIRAADERGAITPLRDACLTKDQIRLLSKDWGLPTWDKPAAACLSSRVAYGIEVSPFRLSRIERAESAVRSALHAAGIDVRNLRVRDLGDHASIEIDAELVPAAREAGGIEAAAQDAGFSSAEIDDQGFRSGSMNDLLVTPEAYR